MKTIFPIFILTFCCFSCFAAEDEVYRRFLSLVDTNDARAAAIKSPLLVDPTNKVAKVTGVLTLKKLKEEGSVAGLRLGMIMGEVVASWGKPPWIWSHCIDRLPSFAYEDAMLGFEGNCLKVIKFNTGLDMNMAFENGLTTKATIDEWIRVLGKPTERKGFGNGGLLTYAGPKGTMTLFFHYFHKDDEMVAIQLERPEVQPQK